MYKIECFHRLGISESERLKVTALNLFHPTASPPYIRVSFVILRHNLPLKVGLGQMLLGPFPSPSLFRNAQFHIRRLDDRVDGGGHLRRQWLGFVCLKDVLRFFSGSMI